MSKGFFWSGVLLLVANLGAFVLDILMAGADSLWFLVLAAAQLFMAWLIFEDLVNDRISN